MRTRLFSAKAPLRLFHAMLVALALLTVGSGARAAVPLCSDDGRTIAAPPVMRPSPSRTVESAGDCEKLRALLSHSKPGKNQRQPIELGDARPRAVPVRAELPASPLLARLGVKTDFERALPAATEGVFRPPRAG